MFESDIHFKQPDVVTCMLLLPGRTAFNHYSCTWRGWIGYRGFFEHEKTLPHFETIIARIIAKFSEDFSIHAFGCKQKMASFDKAILATHHISCKWVLSSSYTQSFCLMIFDSLMSDPLQPLARPSGHPSSQFDLARHLLGERSSETEKPLKQNSETG